MAIQRDSVSKYPLFPKGHFDFVVESRPEKFRTPSGKATYRKWYFGTMVGGEKRTFETVMFSWDSQELLLVLGGTLEGDEVIWDDDKVCGKEFTADVVHEADYKGEIRATLKNVEEKLPF